MIWPILDPIFLWSDLGKFLNCVFGRVEGKIFNFEIFWLFLRKFGKNQQFSPAWMDWASWKSLDCSCTVQQTWIGGFFHLSWCKCQLNSTFKPSNKSEYWSGLTKKTFLASNKVLEPVCCKKRQKIFPDQLLVWGIRALWSFWMVPNWSYRWSWEYLESVWNPSSPSEVPYSTNQ